MKKDKQKWTESEIRSIFQQLWSNEAKRSTDLGRKYACTLLAKAGYVPLSIVDGLALAFIKSNEHCFPWETLPTEPVQMCSDKWECVVKHDEQNPPQLKEIQICLPTLTVQKDVSESFEPYDASSVRFRLQSAWVED